MQGNIKRAKRAAAYAARAEKTGDRDGDTEFLRQIRDAVTAARHADLAFFEGGISLGDLMRALEKQGLDKKVVKSEVIQRFGLYQSPNAFFRVHCPDLVDVIRFDKYSASKKVASIEFNRSVRSFKEAATAADQIEEVDAHRFREQICRAAAQVTVRM